MRKLMSLARLIELLQNEAKTCDPNEVHIEIDHDYGYSDLEEGDFYRNAEDTILLG